MSTPRGGGTYPGPGGGGVPTLARSRWGVPTLARGYPKVDTPLDSLPSQGRYLTLAKDLLHGGRYASCVHAGGLSCYNRQTKCYIYNPHMRTGNNFIRVCLSAQVVTFEPLQLGISFLVYKYILTISKSSLGIKVIGSRSNKKWHFLNLTFTSVCLYSTKTYLKGQGHLKVKVTHCEGQIKGN